MYLLHVSALHKERSDDLLTIAAYYELLRHGEACRVDDGVVLGVPILGQLLKPSIAFGHILQIL